MSVPLLVLVLLCPTGGDMRSTHHADKRSVACFNDLGCFATEGPFGYSAERPLVLSPQTPERIGTVFQLYTRESGSTSQNLEAVHLDRILATWTHFKARPTKILSHGFMDNSNVTPFQRNLKDKLLEYGDFNVVIVDWSKGNSPPYTQATANTRVVGAQIALLVKELVKTKNVTAADFHLIGHSLGAHISGYAGERIPGLARISGIDPAGPYFENTDPVVRLDPSDALFVDIIHSNGKSLIQLGLGIKQACGHLDFFPNLGRDQPGCKRSAFTRIAQLGLMEGLNEAISCNHIRALHYYVESINSKCPFMGYPCNNENEFLNGKCNSCGPDGCPYMGFHADKSKLARGQRKIIYLTTADRQPFCQYHMEINLKLSSSPGQEERGQISAVLTGDSGTTTTIPLNTSPVVFRPGSVHQFSVATLSDIWNIRSVTLSFTHIPLFLNPFQWNILGLRHPKLYIDEFDIHRQEANAENRFCGSGISVETGHSITLSKPC
ncbi:unnamed protein product [Lymnaea stagnalis]|uniref:Lipase domain-containing protein n=1 Tax=Lymnaea stagnalis TaxID=6523 RepID=A0AAV2HXT7_LYMST